MMSAIFHPLHVVFLVSGMCALVYQLAWQRLLVTFAGGDVMALTIIVTAFMAGLGLGSLIGGRLADRLTTRANAMVFVQAEIGIGAYSLASPWLFHDVLYGHPAMQVDSLLVVALVLFVFLLLPTLLMGLSLPVLARVVSRMAPNAAGRIGMLYAANTIGAALGAFLTTWLLLPAGGVEGALRWAGLGNGLCAACMIFSARRMPDFEEELVPASLSIPSGVPRLCLMVCFATGFSALAAEIVWLRVLGAMAKSSAHTMGTLLGIYLAGLGFGAAAGCFIKCQAEGAWRLLLRLQGTAGLYAACGLATGLHVLGRSFIVEYLAGYEPLDAATALRLLGGWWSASLSPEEAAHVWTYPLLHAVVPLVVMFPATFLMGAGFSLMQKVAHAGAWPVGWRTGVLQGANILGSMAGAAGVICLLIPAWGSAGVFMLLAVIGMLLLMSGLRAAWRIVAALVGAVVVVLLPDQKSLWAAVHGTRSRGVWLAEDASGISLMKRSESEHGRIDSFINGIGQSWIPYGGIHTLLGALPVMLHERPERVALIGLGSGDTLHAMLARKQTQEVWCAEIVAGQIETLKKFASEAGYEVACKALEDPRLRLLAGDGRRMILRDNEKFDVIEADALRPTSANSGMLYSKEYFALLRSRLRPGGMAVTWLPTPRVAATMRKVFPYVKVFGGVVGIGTEEPLRVDWTQIQARMDKTEVWSHFRKAGLDAHTLLKPVVGPGAPVWSLEESDEQEANTDLFPRDEWLLPSLREKHKP